MRTMRRKGTVERALATCEQALDEFGRPKWIDADTMLLGWTEALKWVLSEINYRNWP